MALIYEYVQTVTYRIICIGAWIFSSHGLIFKFDESNPFFKTKLPDWLNPSFRAFLNVREI